MTKLSPYAWLEQHIIPLLVKGAGWPPLKALQQGIIKSFYLLLAALPVIFLVLPHAHLAERFLAAFRASLSVIAFGASLTVAYYLSRSYGVKSLLAACASLTLFVALLPHHFFSPEILDIMLEISSAALFIALFTSILTVTLLSLIKNLYAAMVVILVAVWFSARWVNNLYAILELPVKLIINTGGSLPVVLIIVTLICLLWLGGIHGSLLVNPLIIPIYFAVLSENAHFMNVHAYSELHIVTSTFFNLVFIGGSGCTLPLAVMASCSKVPRIRKLGRVSLLPALANINEVLVYGLPIAMNPLFWIPFIFAPIFVTLTTYGAMWFNIVHKPYFYVPGMVPSVISSYLTTGDWKAPVLVLFNLICVGIFYYPFLREFEKNEIQRATNLEDNLNLNPEK